MELARLFSSWVGWRPRKPKKDEGPGPHVTELHRAFQPSRTPVYSSSTFATGGPLYENTLGYPSNSEADREVLRTATRLKLSQPDLLWTDVKKKIQVKKSGLNRNSYVLLPGSPRSSEDSSATPSVITSVSASKTCHQSFTPCPEHAVISETRLEDYNSIPLDRYSPEQPGQVQHSDTISPSNELPRPLTPLIPDSPSFVHQPRAFSGITASELAARASEVSIPAGHAALQKRAMVYHTQRKSDCLEAHRDYDPYFGYTSFSRGTRIHESSPPPDNDRETDSIGQANMRSDESFNPRASLKNSITIQAELDRLHESHSRRLQRATQIDTTDQTSNSEDSIDDLVSRDWKYVELMDVDAGIDATPHRAEQICESATKQQKALPMRNCSVCSDPKPVFDFPALYNCAHSEVCHECFTSWIATNLVANSWRSVRCPAPDCGSLLEYHEVQAYAAPEIFERYDNFIMREALGNEPDFMWCTVLGCGSGQIHDGGNEGNIFMCVGCGHRTCTIHKVAWHEGETCDEYTDRVNGKKRRMRAKVEKQEKASELAVEKLTKKCPSPSCRAPIEKNGGCNHMTCQRCKHEFCWLCLADYEPIRNQGNQHHREDCEHFARG